MADQDLLPNSKFRLYRKGPGDEDFKFVCLATTISFMRTASTEDVTVNNCDDPGALPYERTVKTTLSWSVDFSGKSDPLRIQGVEIDYEATDPSEYQIVADVPLAKGGQTYTGPMHITELTLTRPEKGAVAFTAKGKGDGQVVRAPAAV